VRAAPSRGILAVAMIVRLAWCAFVLGCGAPRPPVEVPPPIVAPTREATFGFADLPSLHSAPMPSLVFHPNGRGIFVRGSSTIGLLDLESGLLRAELPRAWAHTYYRPRDLFAIGAGRYVPFCWWATDRLWRAAVWDIDEDAVLLRSSEGLAEHGDDTAVTPDGSLALRFESDRRIAGLELPSGRTRFELPAPRGTVRQIEFDPDLRRAYVWIAEDFIPPRRVATLLAIALDDGRELGRVERNEWQPHTAFHHARGLVAIAWEDGALEVRRTSDLELVRSQPIGQYAVAGLDGDDLLVIGDQRLARIDLASGEERSVRPTGITHAYQVYPAGGNVYVVGAHHAFWRVPESGPPVDLGPALSNALSPDGSLIALEQEQRIVLRDARTGEEVRAFPLIGAAPIATQLFVAPDGHAIALRTDEHVLVIGEDGVQVASPHPADSEPIAGGQPDEPALPENLEAFDFVLDSSSRAHSLLAACARERGLCVWDTRSGRIRARLAGTASEQVFEDDHGNSHYGALSPDGTRALVNREGEWRLYDARTGRLLERRSLEEDAGGVELFSNELALVWHGDPYEPSVRVIRVPDHSVVLDVQTVEVIEPLSHDRYVAIVDATDTLHVIDVHTGARVELAGVIDAIGFDASGSVLRVRVLGGIEREIALPSGDTIAERVVDPNAWFTEQDACTSACAFTLEDGMLVRARDGARFGVHLRRTADGELVLLITDPRGRFWIPRERLSMLAMRTAGAVTRVSDPPPEYTPELLRELLAH
jgi:hypothetical protein